LLREVNVPKQNLYLNWGKLGMVQAVPNKPIQAYKHWFWFLYLFLRKYDGLLKQKVIFSQSQRFDNVLLADLDVVYLLIQDSDISFGIFGVFPRTQADYLLNRVQAITWKDAGLLVKQNFHIDCLHFCYLILQYAYTNYFNIHFQQLLVRCIDFFCDVVFHFTAQVRVTYQSYHFVECNNF